MNTSALDRSGVLSRTSCYAFLAVAALVVLYPFWILIIDSMKTDAEFTVDPLGLPRSAVLSNFAYAWNAAHLGRLYFNSTVVAAGTVLLTLVLASTAAYGFSSSRFRGRQAVFLAIVSMITIPVQIYIIPFYMIVVRLGLVNTYLALILPYTAASLPLAVLPLRTYFDGLPPELAEAAQINGCSRRVAFMRIVMPLSRPALSAVAIFTFVHSWNEFFLVLVFIQNPALQTLPLGLQVFFLNEYQVQFPRLFATLVLSIALVTMVYMLMQRQFIAGLTTGAVKG